MPPPFKIEVFKQRLAETIAWCKPRFSTNDIEQIPFLLRTPPYPSPEATSFVIDNLPVVKPELRCIALFAWNHVFPKRATAFTTADAVKYQGLCDGKLLISFIEYGLWDGGSYAETAGYIDEEDLPPWDTWVYYGREERSAAYPEYRSCDYLIPIPKITCV